MKKTNRFYRRLFIMFWLTLTFLLMFATAVLVHLVTSHSINKHFYPKTMYVYQVDNITDTVTLVDSNHELWQFKGVEDWAVGDCCSLIMYDNHTPHIKDDTIERVKYNGFSSCGELPIY